MTRANDFKDVRLCTKLAEVEAPTSQPIDDVVSEAAPAVTCGNTPSAPAVGAVEHIFDL
jgi:hypothetical protein